MKVQLNPSLIILTFPIARLHEDPQNVREHDDRNIGAIVASQQLFSHEKCKWNGTGRMGVDRD